MEDKHNKLDRFLLRHLNETSEDQNWNVPDDAIFEKAMRAVANEKKKTRKTWLLIPLFLLSGLAVNEYLHNRQIKMLEGKINHLEDSLSAASQSEDVITSDQRNSQGGESTLSTISSNGIQPIQVLPFYDAIPHSTASNLKDALPTSPLNTADGTTSTVGTIQNKQTKPNPTAPDTDFSFLQAQSLTSTVAGPTNAISTLSEPQNTLKDDTSDNNTTYPFMNENGKIGDVAPKTLSLITSDTHWMTAPIPSREVKELVVKTNLPLVFHNAPDVEQGLVQTNTPSNFVMQYGLLAGTNQSWLTMKNIPPNEDAYLHDYKNSQPGTSLYGYVNKSISSKFSWQTGINYQVYHNRSILESQFLFDSDLVFQAPNGDSMYQTHHDLINPLGDYIAPLEFRVTDQMEEEDVLEEYTTIEQTLQCVMMDLQIRGTILTLNNLRISLGTGLGLAYRSGLKNTFNVSTYHNNILQKTQTEAPDHLANVRRWYVQWLGNINLEYSITNRFGVIMATQYNRGLTSIRNTPNTTGPLTFVHAFSVSAGLTHNF